MTPKYNLISATIFFGALWARADRTLDLGMLALVAKAAPS